MSSNTGIDPEKVEKANRVRLLRILGGLTQEHSMYANVSVSSYSQFENRARWTTNARTIQQMAMLFGVSKNTLELGSPIFKPILFFPHNFEARQIDAVQNLVETQLSRLVPFPITSLTQIQLSKGKGLLINRTMLIIVDKMLLFSLNTMLSQISPDTTNVPDNFFNIVDNADKCRSKLCEIRPDNGSGVQRIVGINKEPHLIEPWDLYELVQLGEVSELVCDIFSKRLTIVRLMSEYKEMDWVKTSKIALELIKDEKLRRDVAKSLVLEAYPEIKEGIKKYVGESGEDYDNEEDKPVKKRTTELRLSGHDDTKRYRYDGILEWAIDEIAGKRHVQQNQPEA